MEFNGLLVLAVVWVLLNLISSSRRRSQHPPAGPREHPRPPTLPAPRDATQQEGSRLELVLRELQRSLEQAEASSRAPTASLPRAEEVENRESLETDAEVRSLEGEVRREPRRTVDRDDEAGNIEAQRIQAAAARDSARTQKDHVTFDQRIRQEAADHTAAPRYTARQLRDAVVWREILGPPVSLRQGEKA